MISLISVCCIAGRRNGEKIGSRLKRFTQIYADKKRGLG